jgi:hypothetical protein
MTYIKTHFFLSKTLSLENILRLFCERYVIKHKTIEHFCQQTSGSMEPNLETLNDEEFRKRIPAVTYLGILILFGFPGNISILITYGRFYRRTTHGVFILALATIDMASCVISMPFEIVARIEIPVYILCGGCMQMLQIHHQCLCCCIRHDYDGSCL